MPFADRPQLFGNTVQCLWSADLPEMPAPAFSYADQRRSQTIFRVDRVSHSIAFDAPPHEFRCPRVVRYPHNATFRHVGRQRATATTVSIAGNRNHPIYLGLAHVSFPLVITIHNCTDSYQVLVNDKMVLKAERKTATRMD